MKAAQSAAALERSARIAETACGTGRMVWRIWGSGPAVVLLHGGYGSWNHWIRTIPALAEDFTVHVPDIPGLGDSDEAPEPGDPPAIAAVVAAGLRSLGLDPAALHLVGFSFGAMIGGHVAALERLRSLTLVGAGALGLPREPVTLLREEPHMTDAERRAVHRTNLGLLMIADPEMIDDEAVELQAANVARSRVKSRRFAKTAALADALALARPGRLNAVWGERDAVAGPHLASREAYFRSLRADASFTVVPDAGHWVSHEAPEVFNALLKRLLAEA